SDSSIIDNASSNLSSKKSRAHPNTNKDDNIINKCTYRLRDSSLSFTTKDIYQIMNQPKKPQVILFRMI
ncbi:hypothetical protein ACHAXS_000542, partial [Conticribra weissflogii]